MQESFLTAFTKLDILKEFSMFGSWLKRIVINKSIHEYHKTQRNKDVPLDDVIYKVEDEQGLAEDDELTNDNVAQILRCIKSLKDNYQIALTLFLIEGYDYE